MRALVFRFRDGRIRTAEIIWDPVRVRSLDIGVLP